MDGNRRYGKQKGITDLEAKIAGLNTLLEIITHSHRLGIKEITVYALSIDNLRRDPVEIQNILKLLDNQFNFSCGIKPKFIFYGFDINPEIKNKIEKIESESGNDIIVNVMFQYSGSREYKMGLCFVSKPDIIIRTSGVNRLSDFLLIHAANGSKIMFVDQLWPMYTTDVYEQNLLTHVLEDFLLK
ncbi:Dehydrodolichyl diphosphate synthase [Dictyocoela muelleri]|nr:Dehydrodolichyl diphosphate synthase [Dictyocoela muelleri]